MAEKLLLHIQYECNRRKLNLPWDAIAHRFHPGSSGQAVGQHLNRLRRELIAEGHLVPPRSHKAAPPCDPSIRGYIRQDLEGGDLEVTRPVFFDEKVDDPKFSLGDAAYLPDDEEIMTDTSSDAEGSPELPDFASLVRLAEPPSPLTKARLSDEDVFDTTPSFPPPEQAAFQSTVASTRRSSPLSYQSPSHMVTVRNRSVPPVSQVCS